MTTETVCSLFGLFVAVCFIVVVLRVVGRDEVDYKIMELQKDIENK